MPTAAQFQPAAAPYRSRAWIWWIVGGCAVLILVAAGAMALGGAYLFNQFQHGSFSCLPSDFPTYPGATFSGQYTYVGGNVAPGDTHECQITLESQDDVTTVTGFYQSHLSSGDWTIKSYDSANGTISFSRSSRPATVGTLQLLGRGQHTEVQIRLDS